MIKKTSGFFLEGEEDASSRDSRDDRRFARREDP
jgi:hypothetical protein